MVRLAVATVACLVLVAGPRSLEPWTLATLLTDRQTWTVTLPPGRLLGVDVTIGDVRIQGEPRRDAQIEIVRSAPTVAALARIPARVDETSAAVHLVALQADDGKDPAFRTDVTLHVPRDASLKSVHIAEGRLTLTSLAGDIEADVRRGSIDATDIQGTVRLETSIGGIVANGARLSADGLLRFRTFNGDVRLTLAERPRDARILALAVNGTIDSDIPLRLKETWGPRWGEATLGKGEPVISIDVVTGRIEIRVQ